MKRKAGRIKVFVIDDTRLDGVGWWRNSEPFAALDKMHGDALDIHFVSENVDIRHLKTADVVVRFRPTSRESLEFLKVCKDFGIKLILDIDDDLWNIPIGHPMFMESLEWGARLRQIYDLADVIWTSTEQLRYCVGDLGRALVVQNAIYPNDMPFAPMEWKGLAAWRGSATQVADICNEIAKAKYLEVREKYTWIFAGYAPDLPHAQNVRFQRGVSPLAYFLNLKQGLANVFWKPLQENLFNDAKSNIAMLEAAMSGGVCVTNYAGKPGWEFALSEFPDEKETREHFYNVRQAIVENYNLFDVTEKRFKSIVNAVNS